MYLLQKFLMIDPSLISPFLAMFWPALQSFCSELYSPPIHSPKAPILIPTSLKDRKELDRKKEKERRKKIERKQGKKEKKECLKKKGKVKTKKEGRKIY